MSATIASVLAAAESLSLPERRELIELLLQTLDDVSPGQEHGSAPPLSPEWREEVARRSAEYDAGKAETVAWEEIKERWQRRAAGG